MGAQMTPKEILRALNESARAGTLNVLNFLEQHFMIKGTFFRKPIHFEDWQRDKVIGPVFEKLHGRRRFDTFLNGLPKKKVRARWVHASLLALSCSTIPEVYSVAGDKDQARIIFDVTPWSVTENSGH